LFYSLRKKGKQITLNMLLDDLNEALKTTERMIGKFLSEPKRIEKWQKATREKFLEIKINEDMPLGKRISRVTEEMKKIYGPLTRNVWLIHQIIVKVIGIPYLREFYIGAFVEDDHVSIEIIPKKIVEEWKERKRKKRREV